MNLIEKVIYGAGRLRGAYYRGLKGVDMAFNNPSAWSTYGGLTPSAGKGKKPQSTEDALEQFTSWVYIFVSLKAQAIASVPLRLYGTVSTKGKKIKWAGTDIAVHTRPISKARIKAFESSRALQPYITKAADVEEIVDHPFNALMQTINPFSSPAELMALAVTFLDLAGEAYWYLVKNGAGVPEAIWSMPSQYVTPIPGKTLDEFITGYKFQRGTTSMILPIEDVVRFAYPNPKNQIVGMSPVLGIADAVYNNSQMNVYEAAIFENRARVDGLFEVDSSIPMAQVERAKEKFAAEFAGTQQAGKRPLLPPGMKFTQTSMSPDDIQFPEGRRLTREEIASGLNFPISLLDPNSIRSNVDSARYILAKYGLEPILQLISNGINQHIIPMYSSGDVLFAEFDSVVPSDLVYELDARMKQTGVPILSINEAREEIGKDAIGGGDLPFIPFGMSPLGEEPPEPVAPIIMPQPDKPKPGDEDVDATAEELAGKTMKMLKEMLGA